MPEASDIAISICIPAYKNVEHLRRLLISVGQQNFKNFEVVITDDTPDNSVSDFISGLNVGFIIHYYKNLPALGTPENWNEAIRRANGKYIKLMHNDDWFSSNESLNEFWKVANQNKDCSFFFSAFNNITEPGNNVETVKCSIWDRFFLKITPLHLFRRVYVGNPSCTLVKRDIELYYDKRFKFVVDFEYYIRCFRMSRYKYINHALVNIGIHQEQVTKYTFLVPEVQVPENLELLEKLGVSILRNIVVYDYYWRLVRNLNIRSVQGMASYYEKKIPGPILSIINRQGKISSTKLKKGIYSKTFMLISYCKFLFKGS